MKNYEVVGYAVQVWVGGRGGHPWMTANFNTHPTVEACEPSRLGCRELNPTAVTRVVEVRKVPMINRRTGQVMQGASETKLVQVKEWDRKGNPV